MVSAYILKLVAIQHSLVKVMIIQFIDIYIKHENFQVLLDFRYCTLGKIPDIRLKPDFILWNSLIFRSFV